MTLSYREALAHVSELEDRLWRMNDSNVTWSEEFAKLSDRYAALEKVARAMRNEYSEALANEYGTGRAGEEDHLSPAIAAFDELVKEWGK